MNGVQSFVTRQGSVQEGNVTGQNVQSAGKRLYY